MLLAIDTSTRVTGVAVLDGDRVMAELVWHSELNHSQELLPNLERVLDIAGASRGADRLAAIDAIAVALGPGGYGGLRVGVSTAKAFALVRGIDIVGVDTLAAQAACCGAGPRTVWAALPAGRDELACARYRLDGAGIATLAPPSLLAPERLGNALQAGDFVAGELPPETIARLGQPPGVTVVAGPGGLRRPWAVGWLGRLQLASAGPADPSTLQPVYLRRPAITEPRRPPNPSV